MSAKPFLIVSSGRSGTAMLHKALSAAGDVEMHHEYMVHVVQPLAVRRHHGLIDARETLKILGQTHAAAARYSEAVAWGDSSNKLSWLIPELAQLMPDAKFVHLVRDGRKVSSSYFHKLGAECYDDRSTRILRAHIEDGEPAPPPEKKYWWPLPPKDLDQFGRIAWHWAEINRVILASLAEVAPERQMFVRLEDLLVSPRLARALFAFLDLDWRDERFAVFTRPHNVNRPEDKPLTAAQRTTFDGLAGTMMAHLGYADREEYVVNY